MPLPTVKTEGIVLSSVKYGEGCIIVNILTRAMGRLAYMVSMTGSKRRQMLPLTQPLSVVELEAYNNSRSSVQRLKEMHVAQPLASLPFDPVRRSIGMFLTELICKSVRVEIADEHVYDFIRQSVLVLDAGIDGQCNFHLYFMWRLMRYLGFEPDVSSSCDGDVFDMVNGSFVGAMPLHQHVLTSPSDIHLWLLLSEMSVRNLGDVKLNRDDRQRMISLMEQFYSLHIPGFNGLNSATVFAQLV